MYRKLYTSHDRLGLSEGILSRGALGGDLGNLGCGNSMGRKLRCTPMKDVHVGGIEGTTRQKDEKLDERKQKLKGVYKKPHKNKRKERK